MSKLTNNTREEDLDLVHRILSGDENAWANFVDCYTDWVFYTANQWTIRPGQAQKWNELRIFKKRESDRKYTYSEEALDVYIWIMDQLRKKLNNYTGKSALSTYVWALLHSRYLFVDFLRWKYGDPRKIPNALKSASRKEKKVFILLRMRKSMEQVAMEMKTSIQEAEALSKEVVEILRKAGLEDMVLPTVVTELSEDLVNSLKLPETNWENRMALREIYSHFGSALNQLSIEEQGLLRLAYNIDLNSKGILDYYQQIGGDFPGEMHPDTIKPKEINSLLLKLIKKITDILSQQCKNMNNVKISEPIVSLLLKEIGIPEEENWPF